MKIKCSICAYAVYRKTERDCVCRHPGPNEDSFVKPSGEWCPIWCPKLNKENSDATKQIPNLRAPKAHHSHHLQGLPGVRTENHSTSREIGDMNELALFAGGGGGILGGHLLGWKTVCAVEIEDYPRRILLARQRDGILPRFPIWDDVQTFDATPWIGRVDIITGGFPCQDISSAGKGKGIDGERSGLWSHMARIIRDIRPRRVFVENSPLLTSRGLGRVLGDLAEMGYNAEWGVLGCNDVGGPHKRERIWILAYTDKIGREEMRRFENRITWKESPELWGKLESCGACCSRIRRIPDSEFFPMANGVASGLDELATLGNGQVPIVAATAYRILDSRIKALANRLGI